MNDDDMKRAFYGRGAENDLVPVMAPNRPKPNNAPTYMCLYPGLASIARAHGYALAVHGSLARDMDLIAVPWVESPGSPEKVVSAIESEFAIARIGELTQSHHGRLIQTIGIKFGECFIDLSFMPLSAAPSFSDGIEAAAKLVEKRMDDYVNEHGSSDPDTGAVEFPGNGEEYVGELVEISEAIRSLAKPSA